MDAAVAIQTGPKWSGDAGNMGAGAGVTVSAENSEGSPLSTVGTATPASFRSSWSDSLQALEATSGDTLLTALTVGKGGADSKSGTELPQSRVSTKAVMRDFQTTAIVAKAPGSKASSAEGAVSALELESTHAKQKKDDAAGTSAAASGGPSLQPAVLVPVPDPAGQSAPVVAKSVPKQATQGVYETQFSAASGAAANQDAGPVGLLCASHGTTAGDDVGASGQPAAPAHGKDTFESAVPDQDTHGNGTVPSAAASSAVPEIDLSKTSLAEAQAGSANALATPQAGTPVKDRSVERQGLLQGGRSPDAMAERSSVKTAHSTARASGATDGSWSVSPSSESGALDASPSLLRELGSPTTASGSQANSTHGLSSDSSTLSSKDALVALDADRGTPATAWIHAGAHHAEAGYLDPALGWVGVRADSVGGGVHASVVPGSSEAAQVLGSHLSGLNAYLAGEHQQSATVTLATPRAGLDGAGLSQGSGGGTSHTDNPEQGSDQSGNESTRASAITAPSASARDPVPIRAPAPWGGMHISVLA